jgi:ABC-type transport system involved in cytochrome bd biosynthesis fused ATPase/permease subunit
LLQQIIVAVSTYILVLLSETSTHHFEINIIPLLLLFVGLLFIVYIPDTYSVIFLEKARYDGFDKYVSDFCSHYFGKTEIYNNVNAKHDIESWITTDARHLIDDFYVFIHDFLSVALNILLNIVVIGVFISSDLILMYLAGFVIMCIIIFLSQKTISNAASEYQRSRQKLSNHLLYSWDNIIIGNKINLAYWQEGYRNTLRTNKDHAVFHQWKIKILGSMAVISGLIPVAIGMVISIKNNADLLWPIIVTLHRQVTIIQHFSIVTNYLLQFSSFRQRGKLCIESMHFQYNTNCTNLLTFIQFEQLSFERDDKAYFFRSFEELKESLQQKPFGRLCIRGKNGSGKTCLLLLLKNYFNDKAIYIPTDGRLFFEQPSEYIQMSTGITKLQNIDKALPNAEVIILDEWDANLDTQNVILINQMLAHYSKDKLLIEVLHG